MKHPLLRFDGILFSQGAGIVLSLRHFATDFFNVKILHKTPVFYFYREKNVGDLLTPYLIEKITGTKTHNTKSRKFRHILAVGSMIHRAKPNSEIWGTGTLDKETRAPCRAQKLNIHAARGHLTAALLYGRDYVQRGVTLGDPGLLMPKFFKPQVEKSVRVGIIPHYLDYHSECIIPRPGISVIDVRQEPEEFIIELLRCEYILSSSLHGLILADAYGVKNKWISFSADANYEGFKYRDYYSTTDSPNEGFIGIDSGADLLALVDEVDEHAAVKQFMQSTERLLDAFPW